MFNKDSATHILAEAAALIKAKVGFSPIAMASPVLRIFSPKEVLVTATSATGTCHGPTIWSRSTKPVINLSPIVIKKLLDPTDGSCKTLAMDSDKSNPETLKLDNFNGCVVATLDILGGFPNNTDISKSIGVVFNKESVKTNLCSSVATPTTAIGHLSLSQILVNNSKFSSATPKTKRSWDSLHHISMGDIPGSKDKMERNSNLAPKSLS